MTFNKPTFVKPDASVIADIDYWDVYQGGLKIGTMSIVNKFIHLEILYNKYEIKESEKSRILPIINMEYTKAILHIVGSIKEYSLSELKERIDHVNNSVCSTFLPKQIHKNENIKTVSK